MKPTFSVIIPTLNEEKFVGNLLASLASQTHKNFEVIISDGKSRDLTYNVVKQHKQQLQTRFISGKERNVGMQRNRGAREATGEWLVFVDADAVLLPYFFDRVKKYISETKCAACTTWCRSDSETRGDAILALFNNVTVETAITLKRPIAPGTLTIVQRTIHEKIGGYDERVDTAEDVDYGRRLWEAGFSLHIIRETLYIWSLRRFRKEGTLRNLQRFALSALLVLLTKGAQKSVSGYIFGGALYSVKKNVRLSFFHKYEKRLKLILKDIKKLYADYR